MSRILLTLTALLSAVAVATGCGNDDPGASGAPSLVPAGSVVYGEATLDPEGDQQAAINSLIEKFPGQGSAGDRIRGLLEQAFSKSDTGLSYSKDIEPWLGDQAAFFVSSLEGGSGDAALLVKTDDEGKAGDAIEKAAKSSNGKSSSYKGHDYYAIEATARRASSTAGSCSAARAASRPPSTPPRAALARGRRHLHQDPGGRARPEARLRLLQHAGFREAAARVRRGCRAGPVRRTPQGPGARDRRRQRARRAPGGDAAGVAQRGVPDPRRERRSRRRAAGRLVAGASPAGPWQDDLLLRRLVRRRRPAAAACSSSSSRRPPAWTSSAT